jgi:glycerophosphoryl diester phosphodiesterase
VSAWRGGGKLVVGHRGGRGDGWPAENTLEAFERARAEGATAVELDARTCDGGQVVVFHDPTLERMTRGRDMRRVKDVPFATLRAIDISSWGRTADLGGERIPLLADVLAWARARGVAVNVELKHDVPSRLGLAAEAARVVREAGADVLYSSFDPLLLAMVGALHPSAPRALLVHARQERWADLLQEAVRPPAVSALHLERSLAHPAAVEKYLQRGLRVGVWTVNEPREATHLARSGAASIITDRPGEVLAALAPS